MADIVNRNGESITTDDERQILDTINKWLDRDVRDQVLELEHADAYPHEMVEQMKEMGLFGATIPPYCCDMVAPNSPISFICSTIS